MLTKSGAKLLDFGLARTTRSGIVQAMASAVQTAAPDLTAQGTIVGTFQYMAPEQLEAKDADARTDIFSFGAVLYEMLSGRKAFDGRSQASLIAAILEHDPPALATLQPLTPAGLDRVVRTCLAKDPDARWQSASDLARELAWILESPTASMAVAPTAAYARSARTKISLTLAADVLLGLSTGYLLLRSRSSSAPLGNTSRVLLTVAPADQLRAHPGDRARSSGHLSQTAIALSPDGQSLVFSAVLKGQQQLYVRSLAELEATPLAGTEDGATPFFSPDGQWVGFWADGLLKKLPLGGGNVTTLCKTSRIFGASWGDNDVIAFANESGGLRQVSAAGGPVSPLTQLDTKAGEVSHRLPQMLPGSRTVMFTVTRSILPTWDDTQIVTQSLAGDSRRVVMDGAAHGRYVRSGHLVYVRRATLNAAAFNLDDLRVTGGGVTLVGDLMQAANMEGTEIDSGSGQYTISDSGWLAYVRGGLYAFPERLLVWVDRSGRIEPLAAPPRAYAYPRLSPDASRVLVSTQGDRNIWIYGITRGTTRRVTEDGRNMAAIWTPDGRQLAYGSSSGRTEKILWRAADGSGSAERLTDGPSQHRVQTWSPDGRTLIYLESPTASPANLFAIDVKQRQPPRAVFGSRFNEQYADLSPDGQWLAYTSDESGRSEVYVTRFPRPGSKVAVSGEGGHSPAWTANGREIVYLAPRGPGGTGPFTVMSVSVSAGSTLTVGKPKALRHADGFPSQSPRLRCYG
jgi:serine/threonine-protein kinase